MSVLIPLDSHPYHPLLRWYVKLVLVLAMRLARVVAINDQFLVPRF